MDKILFEIKITNSCEEIKRLEILNDILKNVGADASFEKEQSGENFLKIRYDKGTIRKIKSRKAGAKSIKLKRKISIKEVEKWIDVTTAKEVAEELGVSRSTLFRRIKEAKNNIKDLQLEAKINIISGDAVEILPTLEGKYDVVFIDAAKGKYPFFLEQALRLLKDDGIIFADNILYKGYVMSDYNKHKQRTAVRNLREFLKELDENEELEVKVLEVGDGLAIARKK